MPLILRPDRTATGRAKLIASGDCDCQDFPCRAQEIIDHFGMKITKKIDGLDVLMWITRMGESQFCVSWDIWFPEVSIIAWENTLDAELEQLTARA